MLNPLLMPTGVIDLNGPEHFVHWGVLQISAGNLAIIIVMILLFVLALVLPFPGGRQR
jgi:hypothetical protein